MVPVEGMRKLRDPKSLSRTRKVSPCWKRDYEQESEYRTVWYVLFEAFAQKRSSPCTVQYRAKTGREGADWVRAKELSDDLSMRYVSQGGFATVGIGGEGYVRLRGKEQAWWTKSWLVIARVS